MTVALSGDGTLAVSGNTEYSVLQWRTSAIVGAGFQNVIAADPRGNGVMLSGADVAGVHRSEDWGDNWVTSNAGHSANNIMAMIAAFAFSPTDPDVVMAAYGYQGAGGIARSTDNGRTWDRLTEFGEPDRPEFAGGNVPSPPTPSPVTLEHPRSTGNLLAWDAARGYLYAGSYDHGLYRGQVDPDTGVQTGDWVRIGTASGDGKWIRSIALDLTHDRLFVAAKTGAETGAVWYIANPHTATSATTWSAAGGPAVVEEMMLLDDDAYLYAVSADTVADGGVWRATTLGGTPTWTKLNDGNVSAARRWCSIAGYVNPDDDHHHVWIGCQNSGVTYGPSVMRCLHGLAGSPAWASITSNGSYVHRTIAGAAGETWWFGGNNSLMIGGSSYVAANLHICAADTTRLFAAGRSGLWRSDNYRAATPDWYPVVRGLMVTVCRGVLADPRDNGIQYAASTDWDFFVTQDHWHTLVNRTDLGGSMTLDLAVHPASYDVYASAADRDETSGDQNLNGLIKHMIAGGGTGGTAAWTSDLWPVTTNRPIGIAVGVSGGNTVLIAVAQATTRSGSTVVANAGTYRRVGTTGGGLGNGWSKIGTGPPGTGNDPASHAAPMSWPDADTSPYVFCYDRANGVYRSKDAGASWSRIWTQASNSEGTGYLAYDPGNDILWISSQGALYRLNGAAEGSGTPASTGRTNVGPVCTEPGGRVYYAQKASADASVQPGLMMSAPPFTSWTDLADDTYRGQMHLPADAMTVGHLDTAAVASTGNGLIVGDYVPPGTTGTVAFVGDGAVTVESLAALGAWDWELQNNWPPPDAAEPIVAATVTAEPSLIVEVAFRDQPVGGFQLDVSQLDSGVVLSDWDRWFEVPGCRSIDVKRRFNRESGTWDPSTAKLRFNNRDRRYDPLYDAGPYTGVLPNRPLRVTFTFPTTLGTLTKRVFFGYIDSWTTDWNLPEQGQADVAATDVSKILAATHMPERETETGDADHSGERADRLIADAQLPEVWLDADRGIATLQGTTWDVDVLAHLRAIGEAEFGYMYVDGAGTLHLMDRYRLMTDDRSVATQVVFGDDHQNGEIPYNTLEVDYDDRTTVNEAVVSREGGRTGSNVVVQSQQKFGALPGAPTSVDLFQRQSKSLRTLYNSDPQAEGLGQYVVGLFEWPDPQVGAVEVVPRDGTMWAAVLSLELGDRITIRRRPPGAPGTLLQIDCHVTGINWKLRPDKPWSCVIETFPARTISDLYRCDHPTFGRVDVNRLAP